MKIRVVELEGTPEELAQTPQLQQLVGGQAQAQPRSQSGSQNGLPDEVNQVLANYARGPMRPVYERLLSEVYSWGDVDIVPGESEQREDGLTGYLRLHRYGSPLGAFAYINPRRKSASFRLPSEYADDRDHARRKGSEESRSPYQVSMRFTGEAHLEEAVELARAAYEKALGE
jgi:hypothetical protein